MLLIAVKNGLGIMAGYIGDEFCTTPYAENIWSFYGAEFGPIYVAVVVTNWDLYGLKKTSNSFHKYFG